MDESKNLYEKLASWWPLLSPPGEYEEEARVYAELLQRHCSGSLEHLLELGCGGGSNAHALKQYFTLTLTDISPAMLEVSRQINPECGHLAGDMRSLRLDREFDGVLIHDALSHMNTRGQVQQALETAYIHTRPGGAALFLPDQLRESFTPSTAHSGYDDPAGERGFRYLEWTVPDRLRDDIYHVHMGYMMREGELVEHAQDHWVLGLFSADEWMEVISSAGFIPFRHERVLDAGSGTEYSIFVAEKR